MVEYGGEHVGYVSDPKTQKQLAGIDVCRDDGELPYPLARDRRLCFVKLA